MALIGLFTFFPFEYDKFSVLSNNFILKPYWMSPEKYENYTTLFCSSIFCRTWKQLIYFYSSRFSWLSVFACSWHWLKNWYFNAILNMVRFSYLSCVFVSFAFRNMRILDVFLRSWSRSNFLFVFICCSLFYSNCKINQIQLKSMRKKTLKKQNANS